MNATIGMMHEAPGRGLAIGDSHLESFDGKACSEMRIQCPSDHPPAKRVKHNGKECKLLSEMKEGDIGNP
nr:hypothetical protein [Sinorhizobium psoraleae]